MAKPPAKTLGTRMKVDLSAANLNPKAWPKFEQLVKRAAEMPHTPHIGRTKKAKNT